MGRPGADLRDEAWRWLAGLPRQQRAVLVLRFYEDLPDHEIAGLLRVGEGIATTASGTVMAVQASAMARDVRTATSFVTGTVTSVDVDRSQPGAVAAPSTVTYPTIHVTEPQKVARLVALANALLGSTHEPLVGPCMPPSGTSENRLTFHTTARTWVLDLVGNCAPQATETLDGVAVKPTLDPQTGTPTPFADGIGAVVVALPPLGRG